MLASDEVEQDMETYDRRSIAALLVSTVLLRSTVRLRMRAEVESLSTVVPFDLSFMSGCRLEGLDPLRNSICITSLGEIPRDADGGFNSQRRVSQGMGEGSSRGKHPGCRLQHPIRAPQEFPSHVDFER